MPSTQKPHYSAAEAGGGGSGYLATKSSADRPHGSANRDCRGVCGEGGPISEAKGADYAMSRNQAESLLGATSLPHDIRVEVLRRYADRHGARGLSELFSQFIGLANSTVENCREMAELVLVTEGGAHPDTAAKINLPTIFGALNGVVLADGIDPKLTCAGCAFRVGTIANQSPSTTCDADWCGHPGEADFMCHEDLDAEGEPTRACSGYAQLRARRKRAMEREAIAEVARTMACQGDDGVICEGDCACKRIVRAAPSDPPKSA